MNLPNESAAVVKKKPPNFLKNGEKSGENDRDEPRTRNIIIAGSELDSVVEQELHIGGA